MANAHDAQLADLTAKHGSVAHVVCAGKLHAFRCPTLDEFEDYQENLSKKRRGVCFRELAQQTCVTSLEELQAAFQKIPVLATRISDALTELAGGDIEVTVKKD